MAQSDFRQRMGIQYNPPQTQSNPLGLQQALTTALLNDNKTQEMQRLYKEVSRYYEDPKAYSNEDLNRLQQTGSKYGLQIDLASGDKATVLENLGAGIVGALDGLLFDLIPDEKYSSRRTETARAIGNWAGIIIPAVITTIGTMGAGAPVVGAAVAKIGLKGGAKKAAMKLGGKEGLNSMRMSEKGLARVSKALSVNRNSIVGKALSITPGGIVGRYIPQAAQGAGQLLSKFGITQGIGSKILGTKVAKQGIKEGAESIAKKASKFAKKGDVDGMTEALSEVGQEYAPYMGDAMESLIKSGKVKGAAGDLLKEAGSKFGKSSFADDALDGIAKSYMGYKKTGKVARGHAGKVMESLRTGLKNNKSIDDIVKEAKIPKSRGDAIKRMWKDPESRADMLKKLAENTPDSDTSIMSALSNLAVPAGVATVESWGMGSSEGMDEIDNASPF